MTKFSYNLLFCFYFLHHLIVNSFSLFFPLIRHHILKSPPNTHKSKPASFLAESEINPWKYFILISYRKNDKTQRPIPQKTRQSIHATLQELIEYLISYHSRQRLD